MPKMENDITITPEELSELKRIGVPLGGHLHELIPDEVYDILQN
jgi:hypothetical protein